MGLVPHEYLMPEFDLEFVSGNPQVLKEASKCLNMRFLIHLVLRGQMRRDPICSDHVQNIQSGDRRCDLRGRRRRILKTARHMRIRACELHQSGHFIILHLRISVSPNSRQVGCGLRWNFVRDGPPETGAECRSSGMKFEGIGGIETHEDTSMLDFSCQIVATLGNKFDGKTILRYGRLRRRLAVNPQDILSRTELSARHDKLHFLIDSLGRYRHLHQDTPPLIL